MSSIVDIQSLSFSYRTGNDEKSILNQLSLTLHQGQLVCLLGANGAGKSTLINLILGRLKKQQGTIALFGQVQSVQQVKHRLGVMLQNSTAPAKATVQELLSLFSSYYSTPIPLSQLITQLNLTEICHQKFATLSGGQQQLVLLALALCGNPDLLFLDEPSVGMDVSIRRVLWQVIEQYKSLGKTIILTTHYLEEADALADRIVVLQHGKITADGTPQELKDKFSHKIIKAKTSLSLTQLQQFDQVMQVASYGRYIELTTSDATATLQQWLAVDPSLEDLSVNNCDLEQAFLQLTSDPIVLEQAS
jgi:ABC-2 type transport system ATP-binding protein